ncbi:MAG TPA: MaoC family dehydratase N-terminal domain-containing protein [Dongiaceae bacterium]|nr:MaoC family dehydratase N-terminal domain-containing protein [Dongiaceae bacterium]
MELLRGWIGRSSEAEDLITPRLIGGFRATFAPYLAPSGKDEAPLGLHWCLAPDAEPMAGLAPDGHTAKGSLLPPVSLPRRMWAGGELELRAPLRLGDKVLRRSTIADITAKRGRSGPLCFVTLRNEFSTARGLVLSERHDIVYRDSPAPGSPPSSAARSEQSRAERSWRVPASPVLLFRYSALTFNGHRIHYDEPYATGAEGYPGLVVHGPLQATLLLNLTATAGAAMPFRFRYRALSALIAGPAFEVQARRGEGSIEGWTRNAGGVICMEATAIPLA